MDKESRDKVVFLMKEFCTLRSVLRPSKPCPYFGVSSSCLDCTYDWLTLVDEVGKLMRVRRASYEVERNKVKAMEVKLNLMEPFVRDMVDCYRSLDFFSKRYLEEEKNDVICEEEIGNG